MDNYISKHPSDEFLYKWKNGGFNSTLFPNQVSFASGECLGGGSEINSGLFHLPHNDFIKDWKNEFDVKDISTEQLNNSLKEINEIR